ncbi:MAG TPA: CHAT domain-containing protein [Leptospiraceae bacterium]|nr:CHAT domain-containing protein [Leptospiraceae bacterium]
MGIHSLNQAMDLILKFRSEMGKDKEAFTERFLDVFRELKKLYLESEQFDRALEVSEKMRGLSVSENFNLKYALSHGGVDSEKGAKLLKLKSELEALASERIVAKHQGDKGKKRENALSFRKEELESYEKTEGHLEKDGFLKMGDVAELDLKTDLLVMSACETSLGTIRAGEGMVGLPQAFLMGGAKNVLATLWSVDDHGTMLFFKEYYNNLLRNKMRPEEASRETQKVLLKKSKEADTKYTDPFYWSPFVIYGE